ncbi:hypothetical protein OPKNFCMD_1154 [Methylobacterium crusticola]|uniref:Uncharacterized protein n=1 Tax=Methylobacterium crusticola TaxID=1697972 RepID=A0ABQ4QSY8_9HYPH|nr:hypothetical protein [Methylobacterium crusticola]GJD48435.1 hypothetical protein OPKNFCMD_1154 [Methylobacterium crusticola]
MGNPQLHHHADGSVHYTYCWPETVEALPACEPPAAAGWGSRLRSGAGVGTAALGLAVAAFWLTMLGDPPVSRAALPRSADVCANAGHAVRVWFEAETARRARVGSSPNQNAFNSLLLWYRSAESGCAAGSTREAVRSFQALERMIAGLDGRRQDREDRED